MNITLNGQTTQVADKLTLEKLVDEQQLTGKRIAIEVNQNVIPRSQHASHQLQEGDNVEIVHAIGGG